MIKSSKLDWIPLYIQRLKASRRWQEMRDFQRGWYVSLLVEAADSSNPGYLPNDESVLWRLAGARTKAFFEKDGLSVLQCFDGRTEDGAWIYNRKMLETIETQTKRLTRTRTVAFSLSVLPVLEIYQDYPRKEARGVALKAIEKAIQKYARDQDIQELDAAQFIHAAVREYRDSPAGRKPEEGAKDFRPHPASWFNGERYLDDRTNWYREEQASNGRKAQTSQDQQRDDFQRMAAALNGKSGTEAAIPKQRLLANTGGKDRGDGGLVTISSADGESEIH